jgi:sugar/nucleoside kinase (ribokinase family)
MSIVAVGSVAFDTIASPSGKVEGVLGGAATYFALAASYFTDVRVVAIVGEDFTAEHENVLKKRGVDTRGIEHAKGKTFRWGGQYLDNLNEAKTDFTDLNVFQNFQPHIPSHYQDSQFLFLANIQPDLQAMVRREMKTVRLTGGDTMNYWINNARQQLAETLKLVDVLLINDTEAKSLAGETNLPRAALKVLAMGPQALVIKHGEYGATIFFREGAYGIGRHPFRAPALPIDEVKDPTGAGDSFAGGFMGYIASQGELSREVLKRALFYGGVMGSFAVERFGTERLQSLTREEIDARFQIFRELTQLEGAHSRSHAGTARPPCWHGLLRAFRFFPFCFTCGAAKSCSTATRWRTSTSRAGYSIPALRVCCNWGRSGCLCPIC